MTMIEMDRGPAQRKLDEYDKAISRGKAVAGDEDLREGYRALARGKCLIDLLTVFEEAGLDSLGRPKLAIVRADAKRCTMVGRCWDQSGANLVMQFDDKHRRWANKPKGRVTIPHRIYKNAPVRVSEKDHEAIVPSIPPEHRRGFTTLEDYHILWEVEWDPKAPVDPYLLKHVSGYLYALVAQWDLTPLEQAVLRSRIGS